MDRNDFTRLAIGLLVPEMNVVIEPEFWGLAPKGVNIFTARIEVKERAPGDTFYIETEKLVRGLPEAAARISHANIDVTVLGCTSASFLKGAKLDKNVEGKIREITGTPVVTAVSAVKDALRALGIKKLAIGTPYPQEINRPLREYLSNAGFRVESIKSIPYEDSKSELAAYNLAKQTYAPDIDGIFISCTDFRTIHILAQLEKELGKPIISSNQASLWSCLRLGGVKDKIEGFGSLFHYL